MSFNEKMQENLRKYAQLSVKSGLNLKKGQILVMNCPIQCAFFAELVAEEAFKAGAKDVVMRWSDNKFTRIRYDYADISRFETVPKWQQELLNGYAQEGAAFLHIISTDPDIFTGIDPKKPAAFSKANKRDCKIYSDLLDIDACVWSIVAIPSPVWAKKVFPNDSEEKAMEKLWEAVLKAVRVDTPDPVAAWEQHKNTFIQKRKWLEDLKLAEINIKTGRGTDLTLGLIDNHLWEGGGAVSTDGTYFFPNMPTEEIFSTPHRLKANGKAVSALPLIYHGTVIDDFYITLENGKIIDYGAKKGYETLKQLVETDEGSHYLGEVALIPNNSPISNMGILFFDTLFDENASCHIAIGRGFPNCVEGGAKMTKEQHIELGINDSATHVDFMIGTPDTEIVGKTKDGKEIVIFKNGNWA